MNQPGSFTIFSSFLWAKPSSSLDLRFQNNKTESLAIQAPVLPWTHFTLSFSALEKPVLS